MDETGNFSLPKSGVENGTQWRSCLNKIRHLALQEWVAFCSRKVVVPIAALVAKNLKVVPLLLASRAVLLNESAFGRHLWFSLSAKKTSKRCKSTLQKQCTTGANLRKKGQMSAHSKIHFGLRKFTPGIFVWNAPKYHQRAARADLFRCKSSAKMDGLRQKGKRQNVDP